MKRKKEPNIMEKVDFELKKNHLILAEKEIHIGHDRIFYDSDNIKKVADALNIEPNNDGSYSDEQQLFCEKLIVEMPLALKIMDHQGSEPGIYSIDKDSAYAEYIADRNYLYLNPLFRSIIKLKRIQIPVLLLTLALTTRCEQDDPDLILREFYDAIKKKSENEPIPWSGLFIQEIEKRVSIPESERAKPKTWQLPVVWKVWDKIPVKAYSLEEAIDWVQENEEEIPLGTEPDYIDGSYHLEDGGNGHRQIEDTIRHLKNYWETSCEWYSE